METTQGNLGEELSPHEIARHLGLTFRSNRLLLRALTHRSYINEHAEALEDNERLEFLGDAILDFLVGAWLYNRFPEKAEGELTRLRAALVGNAQLAEFARQIELGAVVRLGKGETDGGGRDRNVLLGSAFEALIGALFLDQGIPAVEVYVLPLLEAGTDEILAGRKDHDAKSILQEWSQGRGMGAPYYKVTSVEGPDHDRTYEVAVLIGGEEYGRGLARSKHAATKAAAKAAMVALELE